jgi:hypothetical protein
MDLYNHRTICASGQHSPCVSLWRSLWARTRQPDREGGIELRDSCLLGEVKIVELLKVVERTRRFRAPFMSVLVLAHERHEAGVTGVQLPTTRTEPTSLLTAAHKQVRSMRSQ